MGRGAGGGSLFAAGAPGWVHHRAGAGAVDTVIGKCLPKWEGLWESTSAFFIL